MSDIALLFEGPDRSSLAHMLKLVQDALGEDGSVQAELPPELPLGAVSPPSYSVPGIIVCNDPLDEIVARIMRKLVDYEVEETESPGGARQLVVRSLQS